MSELTARIAIVTGAAQGIGKAIALRLADDGLDVAVNDLDTQSEKLTAVAEEIKKKGRRSLAFCADISSDDGAKGLISHVVENLGGLDVMVANAGIAMLNSIFDTSIEEWDRIIRVNARGTFLQYKYAAEQLVKQGRGGRIIGASSMGGKKGFPNMGAYSASKFAVRGLTQTAAQELAKHNITVNAYAPGAINTTLVATAEDAERGPMTSAKEKVGVPLDMPVGETADIAGLVSYIAKPESRFLTGQTICIDGGIYFD